MSSNHVEQGRNKRNEDSVLPSSVLSGPPWTLSHQMSEEKGEPGGYRTKAAKEGKEKEEEKGRVDTAITKRYRFFFLFVDEEIFLFPSTPWLLSLATNA